MEKKDIVYNDLIRLLKAVSSEGENFEHYFNSIADDEKENMIIELSDKISAQVNDIINSKNNDIIHSDFGALVDLLKKFKETFIDYPNNRINEILLLIELISKLNEAEIEIVLTENVDTNVFAFVELTKYIHIKNFIFYDNSTLSNSLALLDMSDIDSLSSYLSDNSFPVELYFPLIAKIGEDQFVMSNSKYILIDANIKDKPSIIWACLALHLVKSGYVIHEPYEYSSIPNISPNRIIFSNLDYQQFNDTLIILSEYNHQRDILDKYLRLYHVLENFMYKFPLVDLERLHNGSVFSIRDFQRIYDNLKKSELASISRLIKKIVTKQYSPLVPATPTSAEIQEKSFAKFIFEKISELVTSHLITESNFDTVLKYLRQMKNEDEYLTYAHITTTENNIAKYFSSILYAFRNSLVHNRETEFHLTHNTLLHHPIINDTCKIILEKFLIPVIEEIAFYLIICNNDIVWYQNSALKLFDEN